MQRTIVIILMFFFIFNRICYAPAQEKSDNPASNESNIKVSEKGKDNTTLLATGVTLGVTTAVLAIGSAAWWTKKGFTGDFNMKYERYFQKDTYAGGTDKVGHLYSCYGFTLIGLNVYQSLGMDFHDSLLLSSAGVFIFGVGVELIDGLTPYGFSYEDALADTLGIALANGVARYPWLDRLLGYRFSYYPSKKFVNKINSNKSAFSQYIDLVNDYNGQLYLFDFKFEGMGRVMQNSFLKYFLVGVNYNTINYSPSGEDKERNVGVHFGLNLPAIFRDALPQDIGLVRFFTGFSKFVALPFIQILYQYDLNHKNSKINFGLGGRLEVYF